MPLFVVRSGALVAVPVDYANDPRHRALVDRLTRIDRYLDAVTLLEQHADSWLAADILTGAPWARRFLLSTARLCHYDPPQARRGQRALLRVLTGTKVRIGRRRAPPLTPELWDRTLAIQARWRADLDTVWAQDRAGLASAVATLAAPHFPLSRSHRRALAGLTRRVGLRKQDLVHALVSWETGVPVRRLRTTTPPVAELIYR